MVQGDALVTGGAGFIGHHLVAELLHRGWRVDAIDNFDPFYDESFKRENIARFEGASEFRFYESDIRTINEQAGLRSHYDVVVHLAALAGVRRSQENPVAYADVNVAGTAAIADLVRERGVPRLVFASSSSVYGVNKSYPWREADSELRPISVYATTKIAGERVVARLAAAGHAVAALRFFTVFGPRQRPDLAITKFAARILRGEPIPVFGDGSALRDFTYVDDVVQATASAAEAPLEGFEVFNVAQGEPVELKDVITAIESALGTDAVIDRQPEVPGDVPVTWGDIAKARELLGYQPKTSLEEGLGRSLEWFRQVARSDA